MAEYKKMVFEDIRITNLIKKKNLNMKIYSKAY